jgi:hypothetical protein
MDSYNSDNLHIADTAAETGAETGEAPASQAQSAAQAVTVAQAGPTQHVATPAAGTQTVIGVIPGTQYVFDFKQGDADFVFSDGNLVILVHGGGEIILENFGTEAAGNQIPPLNFAGDIVSAFDLLSQTASAEQLADIQPAAGPGAGGGGLTGGAAFGPFDPGPLPPSIPGIGPIPPTSLAFLPPELVPLVFPAEEEAAPAAAVAEEEHCVNPCADELAAFFADVQNLCEDDLPVPDASFFDGVVTVLGGGNDNYSGTGINDSIEGADGNDTIDGGGATTGSMAATATTAATARTATTRSSAAPATTSSTAATGTIGCWAAPATIRSSAMRSATATSLSRLTPRPANPRATTTTRSSAAAATISWPAMSPIPGAARPASLPRARALLTPSTISCAAARATT